MKYVTIASAFSGNKGAASMLEASIQTISARDQDASFSVFTTYPDGDTRFNTYKNATLFSAKPIFLGLVINPSALIYRILPPFRPLLRKQKHIKAIAEADVFLDQGGITFVDGRAKFLIYNIATILPALFIGTRVVKCSQAMGPFNTKINRLLAQWVLPHVDTVCARGEITNKYLKSLGLQNVIKSTDYAFLLEIENTEAKKAERLLLNYKIDKKGKTVILMPSEVVRGKAESRGQDYVGYNVKFINNLISQGYKVLLLAYSARAGSASRHNNDLPVCSEIAKNINSNNFSFIDDELSAQALRYIIGKSYIVVTSRFHGMIAGLSMEVPTLVVGWSHKYAEIMSVFDLEGASLDSTNLDFNILIKAFEELVKNHDLAHSKIQKYLPKVKADANKQVNVILAKIS